MALSGNQLTRLGAYFFGAAKKLVITAKSASDLFSVALSRGVNVELENRLVLVELEERGLEVNLETRTLTVKII